MAILTWDGDVPSVCGKVGLLGGRASAGRCSSWSAQTTNAAAITGRVVWSQSEKAAFATSYMPAIRLSSTVTTSASEPRYYVFSGSQAASIDFGSQRKLNLALNEVILLRMDDPLQWLIEKPYVGHSLVVGETMLRGACRSYERLIGQRLGFPYHLEQPLQELLVSAQRAMEADAFEQAGDDLANAILRLVALATPEREPAPSAGPCGDIGVRGGQIQCFIDRNFRDADIGVGRIAERFSISPRYVQYILARSGLTVSEMIRGRRVKEAAQMLRDQRYRNLSITEIAFDCGFNSSAYFSTEFRRAYGASPRSYRMVRN